MVQLRQIAKEELFKVQGIAHQVWHSTFGAILGSGQFDYMLHCMYDLQLLEAEVKKGHTFFNAEAQGTASRFAGFELFYKEGK